MGYVAIDPSKNTLVCYDGVNIFKVPNDPIGWRKIVEKHPDKVYIEGALTYTLNLVAFLKEHNIKVYDISPFQNARMREIMTENKTDIIDAQSAFLLSQNIELHEISISKTHIKILVDTYFSIREIYKKTLQRLHNLLFLAWGKDYKKLFSRRLDSQWILNFLSIHPVPDDTYFEDLPKRKKRLTEIHISKPLFVDTLKEVILLNVKLLKSQKRELENVERTLRQVVEKYHPEILTFPAIPLPLAAEIVAHADKFNSPGAFLAYAGLAPRTVQTGSQPVVRVQRHRFNRRIQAGFFMFALLSIKNNSRAREYFEKKKAQGVKRRAALWATARQLAKILYRILEKRESYRAQKRLEKAA